MLLIRNLRRNPPRLTTRALALLAVGGLWGLVDFVLPGAGWGILLWDVLAAALIIWDYRRIPAAALRLGRTFAPRFSIGRTNPVQLNLTNRTNIKLVYELVEALAWELTVTPRQLTGTLAPSETQSLTYNVTPHRRGIYPLAAAQVRLLSPLRLSTRVVAIGEAEQFSVYPDLEALKELSLKLARRGEQNRPRRRLGISTEFADLRQYGTGDDPRFIDWKATARTGTPIVRIFQEERDQTLLILLDAGRMMTAEVEGLQKFDWALNAALALALVGLDRGDKVGFGIFDHSLRVLLPPRSGRAQLEAILQKVYDQEPRLVEPDYTGAVAEVLTRNPRRALVVVLTDIIDPQASAELLDALGKLAPRHLPFCVTFQDPLVHARTQLAPQTTSQVFQKAVALQLTQQRAEAFRILQRRGALVLDSPVLTLSTQLVDAYLQVKARGRL